MLKNLEALDGLLQVTEQFGLSKEFIEMASAVARYSGENGWTAAQLSETLELGRC